MDSLQSAVFPQPPATKLAAKNLRRPSNLRPTTINTRAAAGRVAQAVQRISAAQMTPPLTPLTATSTASTASTARQSQLSSPVEYEPSFHSYLRAFYHFHPTSPVSSVSEESSITVPINQGDVILVHSIQPNGWADGTLLSSGARGWLPTNYCEAYDHDVIRNLLSALTNVWEFIRGNEDGDTAVFAKQDYVRGMIAGVRVFLERAKCLNRDSPLVQQHAGLRRMRKAILGELSTFVKSARTLQDVCHSPMELEVLFDHLDDIVIKAFRVVTKAVRFLDSWTYDVAPHPVHQQQHNNLKPLVPALTTADMPLTPPADGLTPQTPNPAGLLSVSSDATHDDSTSSSTTATATATPALTPSDEGVQLRLPSQHRLSAAFAPNSLAGQRPSSIASKRTSAAHRWSHQAGPRASVARTHVLASERLNTSHDSFLGSLGAYIGLHMQSRWSMDLLVTTQHSVTSCQSLLAVVDDVFERDFGRSDALEAAKETMEASLAALVQATRDIFHANNNNDGGPDDSNMFMPDQGKRLVDAATLCVRSAGECVSKTRTVIERVGDFEFEPLDAANQAAQEQHTPAEQQQALPGAQAPATAILAEEDEENDSALDMIDQLPLPPLPSQQQQQQQQKPQPPPPPPPQPQLQQQPPPPDDAQMPPPQRPAPSPGAPDFGSLEPVADDTLVPAPLRTAVLRAADESSASRSSSETVVATREENTQTPTPGVRKFPSLDVDIPSVTHFDLSPSPTESAESGGLNLHGAGANPDDGRERNSSTTGLSSADSSSYVSSFRRSEQSIVSHVSTRATTPDQATAAAGAAASSDKVQALNPHASSGSLSDGRDTIAEESEDVEDQFLATTHAHELVFNKDGQVSGGSLPALVEQLTTHDSTPDAIFVNTFYLTFRLFTTPVELARALVDRFDFAGDAKDFATPVRLRVYNVFKGWLEAHWRPESDADALPTVLQFATGRLRDTLPTAGRRLVELTQKVSDSTARPVAQRLLAAVGKTTLPVVGGGGVVVVGGGPGGGGGGGNVPVAAADAPPPPNPIVTKSQLNALRGAKQSCSILDFDALELARQITIIESRIFCAIQPEELLALEWTKKKGSRAPNVKAKSGLSTDLANLVADSILQLEEPKKRALVIKHWVKIATKCEQLHNYDSLMAIVCSLNSSMVTRLRRTWDCVSPKTMAKLDAMNHVTHVSKNYAALRQRLQSQVAPCLPFVGIYLTDLTFVDVGNQSTRQLSGAGAEGHAVSVINFDKQLKTARIIGDLQRFQVPYRLTPVPEMQDWMEAQILRMRDSDQADVQHFYRRSQMLEPREPCKVVSTSAGAPPPPPHHHHPKLQTADSFPGAGGKTDVKLDFWNQFHLPLKDKVPN